MSDYADGKCTAVEAWEAHLAAVLAGGNVVPMRAANRDCSRATLPRA